MNKEETKKMNNISRGMATIASAIICGFLIYTTNGEHGIGWFIVSLLFIWG
jgi:hypothetical protein